MEASPAEKIRLQRIPLKPQPYDSGNAGRLRQAGHTGHRGEPSHGSQRGAYTPSSEDDRKGQEPPVHHTLERGQRGMGNRVERLRPPHRGIHEGILPQARPYQKDDGGVKQRPDHSGAGRYCRIQLYTPEPGRQAQGGLSGALCTRVRGDYRLRHQGCIFP